MKNILLSADDIKKIYEVSYTISESKGKKRQNIINSVVIEALKKNPDYSDCVFKDEVRIPGSKLLWGSYFPVDICVYRNDKIIEIILNKAPASNIKQNRINSINSINGDIDRLSKTGNELDYIKISLINFRPNVSPFFKRNESIKNFENNKDFFLMESGIIKKFNIDEIHVTFDIDNLIKCKNKQDVKDLFIDNNPINNVLIKEINYLCPSFFREEQITQIIS